MIKELYWLIEWLEGILWWLERRKNSSTGNRTLVLGFRVRCPNH